jgi:hypothetical protein
MRRRALTVPLGAASATAAFVACSLGLDPSKMDVHVDAAVPDDAARVDAATLVDAAAPDAEAATGCAKDSDCRAPNACLTGRCDTASRTCFFDECKQVQACTFSACDRTAHVCAPAASVGFHASHFVTSAGAIGCDDTPGHCFAAVWPFVFVGTTNGVFAFDGQPGLSAPPAVPVSGMPFFPALIVASGRRVYFVGASGGTGPTYRIPVAWLDVPTDPLATSLVARSVFVESTQAHVQVAFPAPDAGLFLVQTDQSLYPTARVTAPLEDLSAVSAFANHGMVAGAVPIASSGDRLIVHQSRGADALPDAFALVNGAGTQDAGAGAEWSSLQALGVAASDGTMAVGAGGEIAWFAPVVDTSEGFPGRGITIAARFGIVLGGVTASEFEATRIVDVERYAADGLSFPTQQTLGPITMLGGTSALALAPVPDPNTKAITVHLIAQHADSDGGSPLVVEPTTFNIDTVPIERLAATSANRVGYVLAADGAGSSTVHVFAPSCP